MQALLGETLQLRHAAEATLLRCVPTLAAHEVPEHRHLEAHFVIVERGAYASDARPLAPLARGGALLVFNPPGTEHHDCFEAGQPLADARFVALTVGFGLWSELSDSLHLPDTALSLAGESAQAALQHALAVLRGADTLPLDIDALVAELASLIVDRAQDAGGSAPPWLLRCRDALRDTAGPAAQPARLAALARDAGVHPVSLARAFRRCFGCSPGEFVRAVRLVRAAGLLVRTQRPLADVAADCGYFDQAHFTRHFTRRYGMAPGRYRAMRAG